KEARTIVERTRAVPATICTWEDAAYPAALRVTSNSPCVLYVRGDIRRLTPRALAIVGTTAPLPEFARVAARMAHSCAEHGLLVISGLAKGVDAAALRAALDYEVPAFAVVGHGIDYEYPTSSRPLY